jgi:PBSX family phage terminase large subunit
VKLTSKQQEAQKVLASDAMHLLLIGGSRSGKTFLLVRNVVMRALKAPKSRHVIFRFRFNAIKASVVSDTFPKVMSLCFPGVQYELNKTDYYATMPNGSEIWFAGLDDKERAEKILGMEFVTLYFNEASQIPQSSCDIAITRLAQHVMQEIEGKEPIPLKPRAYYDANPPSKAHWTYKRFVQKIDPDSKQPLMRPEDYAYFKINPEDNKDNVSAGYLDTLKSMSPRLRKRFLDGEFADATPNQLFSDENIELYRVLDGRCPDMVRIVVAVDPSGSGDIDNADNDAIGIVVAGLGIDGNAYLLEDCTVKAGPATWGRIAVEAYYRHDADCIVGEINYGGAMVEHTIRTAPRAEGQRRPAYKTVTATRGKAVRAEPISALYDTGKVRHVGYFSDLEDELSSFSTVGYVGESSPNRADAAIWALTELFPGIVKQRHEQKSEEPRNQHATHAQGWMR